MFKTVNKIVRKIFTPKIRKWEERGSGLEYSNSGLGYSNESQQEAMPTKMIKKHLTTKKESK